ncbi:hypothetical protein [Pseudoalteromonas luteoviolacea]|uniref:Uncharacterized protein n=1 Tax=Pseudoalteromonas luteoviolacea S4054 TaxID=1129367 RepID=A0A0F6A707_9GAMM|nr:hypothetical protein [Pseudoalteromonas luteoviolacea]AOT10993.1 hypothetical protein S4054249_24455 [Pseudoalteromonas luteoviolacea]AOT15843.1 hypothetical protein S40542_24055 [Pseudoalteromonas luteoviolacea]AOT20814.1 hypothetical protein S4054_24375 [Pseudoalteromonas luteoviolacea]KKE81893.1 hypothetical protein N479_20885 [Pseudoalteromonas luteoviolacea S4054]KZN72224.1 hypothetical protein N481_16180 [Pseudoalteromonas luteoviolacea S4047-1]
MSQTKNNIALGIASSALALTLYNFSMQTSSVPASVADFQSQTDKTQAVVNNAQVADFQDDQKYTDMDNSALIARIEYLEERLLDIENQSFGAGASNGAIEETILAVIAEKERQDRQKRNEDNPVYGFYEDLPKDYDLKLKTDPEYATRVSQDLRGKVLDQSLTPQERLSAMGQLQMNMYILNRTQDEMFDYETVDAVLEISRNSSDDKLKVQALEVVAHSPVVDRRIAKSLQDIIEKEPNKYMKTMAAEGLMGQYYQADESNPEVKQQLANDILAMYDNTSSAEVQAVMQRLIKDEELLQQIRRDAGR